MADTPGTFEQPVRVVRPVRVILGVLIFFGAIFFGAIGIMSLLIDRSAMPHPNGALAVGFSFIGLAIIFGLVAVRLVRIQGASDYLFGPSFGTKVAMFCGPVVGAIGLFTVACGMYYEISDLVASGAFLIVSGVWFFWIPRRRKN